MRLIASTGFSRLSSHTQQISRPYIIQQLQLRGQLRNWSSTQLPSRFQSASCNHVRRNVRFHSTEASPDAPRPLTNRNENSTIDQNQYDADTIAARKALSPAYQLWITCKKCLERSSHTISKQAYHFGSCVVQCPKCKNQHLISDNLKVREVIGL